MATVGQLWRPFRVSKSHEPDEISAIKVAIAVERSLLAGNGRHNAAERSLLAGKGRPSVRPAVAIGGRQPSRVLSPVAIAGPVTPTSRVQRDPARHERERDN